MRTRKENPRMSDLQAANPRCYEDLLALLRAQMDKLGLGINQLDEICGFPSGYSGKIFGPSRVRKLGHKSLWLLLPELGLRIAVIEDAQLLAKRRHPARKYLKYQARFDNVSQALGKDALSRVMRHIGRIGGRNRMRRMSKSEFTPHQQRAANARWKKYRAAKAGL